MSDTNPETPAGPVQPTPRPEGETVAPSVLGTCAMGTLGNVPHARDSYHRCANWLPHSDELARLRTEAAALRTESDGRRGLLDLAKTQLAEKEAEIAALRTENNRHKERAKTYDDTEEERYTRLLAENGRLGKQLAERDAEAAAQTKQIEALTGRLAYCVDLAAHEQQLAERDAEAAAQTARESALRAERDAAIEREEKRPFTQAWVDKIHSGWTLETAIQRARADKAERERDEAHVQRADRERDWKAASARADKAELERDEDRATVKSISSMLGWGNIPPRDTLERDIRAKRAAYEFERNGRLAAEAQLAAQMEHCKTLVEALRRVKEDCEICDWECASCGTDPGMTETDLYLATVAALSSAPAAPKEHK